MTEKGRTFQVFIFPFLTICSFFCQTMFSLSNFPVIFKVALFFGCLLPFCSMNSFPLLSKPWYIWWRDSGSSFLVYNPFKVLFWSFFYLCTNASTSDVWPFCSPLDVAPESLLLGHSMVQIWSGSGLGMWSYFCWTSQKTCEFVGLGFFSFFLSSGKIDNTCLE